MDVKKKRPLAETDRHASHSVLWPLNLLPLPLFMLFSLINQDTYTFLVASKSLSTLAVSYCIFFSMSHTLLTTFQRGYKSAVFCILLFTPQTHQSNLVFTNFIATYISSEFLRNLQPLEPSLNTLSLCFNLPNQQRFVSWCFETSKYNGCTFRDAFKALKNSCLHCLLHFILKGN